MDKYCGNCAHSYGKDMDGYCACGIDDHFTGCDEVCDKHIMRINGWTEITPDNVDDIYNLAESRFVDVLDSKTMVVKGVNDWHCTLSTMSKVGGYYYYVLPELKIK